MNILIENAESQEYLGNDGEWTKNAHEGRDFGATQVAFEAAAREPIGRFNIVCYIPQKPQFIIISMDHGTGKGTSNRPARKSVSADKPARAQRKFAGANVY
jgi:hypothetical protein